MLRQTKTMCTLQRYWWTGQNEEYTKSAVSISNRYTSVNNNSSSVSHKPNISSKSNSSSKTTIRPLLLQHKIKYSIKTSSDQTNSSRNPTRLLLCNLDDVQLNSLQDNGSKTQKMTKDLPTYHIQIQVKLDKYKKLIGRLDKNINFVEQLRFLDEDLQSLERQSINIVSRPRPSVINKDQIFPNQKDIKQIKMDSTIDTKIKGYYIGPCYSKNVFSFLDRDKNQHTYSIIEPYYQY